MPTATLSFSPGSIWNAFRRSRREYKIAFAAIVILLAAALVYPVAAVLGQSFLTDSGAFTLTHWTDMLARPAFREMVARSFWVSGLAALGSTVLAFLSAYGLVFTNIPGRLKRVVQIVLLLPLFLPSITYGFAVIYSFGRMGLVSQLIGALPFSIYGFWGLLITNILYTLPPAFLVMMSAFMYVDRRFVIVSRVMGDKPLRTFYMTAVRPTLGASLSAFVLAFFLAFTDFGIPVSIAGQYTVIATELYSTMMGAIPNFGEGAVIAISMLVPSAAAVILLKRADRLNFRYNRISTEPPMKNRVRDAGFLVFFAAIALLMLSVFLVIFIVPFVESWPYQPWPTMRHVKEIFTDGSILPLYLRSVGVALASAAIGTAVAFAAAMIRARSNMPGWCRTAMDGFAMLTSTLPGMVLGVGFLFAFSGTFLQNTIWILILANLVHFLSTPYIMATTALSKMNASWETTGILMGDSWFKSVRRIVVPNARATLGEMFQTYFVNSMVTISAIVFLAGSRTMVLTTRIKELQYYERFDAIFVLSVLIFLTNVVAKVVLDRLAKTKSKKGD